MDAAAALTLRGYRPSDRPALVDICLRTGADGADATGMYADDQLLAAVYATPYALLEPELAFVLDDGSRAVGYILGAADTPRFIERYRTQYLPTVVARYPRPDAADTGATAEMTRRLHRPERLWRNEFAGYPAHLHVDLLPAAQGGGNGRALMGRFLDALRARGVPGAHLGMSASNERAVGFYRRLGFQPLPIEEAPGSLHLGLRLSR